MKTLFLIRHGESAANAGQRTIDADPAMIPLTELGHQQAKAAAESFAAAPGLIACSPMLRARQTVAPLAARFPGVSLEEWPIHELTYLSPDRCRNTTSAERKPMAEAYRLRNDPDWAEGPGAESFTAFLNRVEVAAVQALACSHQTVVLVGHNQFFSALVHRLEVGRLPTMAEFWPMAEGNFRNGEVREVKIETCY